MNESMYTVILQEFTVACDEAQVDLPFIRIRNYAKRIHERLEGEFWTFKEVCQHFKISTSTLKGWIEEGLPFLPLNSGTEKVHRRFEKAAVLNWVKSREARHVS